jgi:hypothetical protein
MGQVDLTPRDYTPPRFRDYAPPVPDPMMVQAQAQTVGGWLVGTGIGR